MEVNIEDVKKYLRRVQGAFIEDYELASKEGNLNDASMVQACTYFISVLLKNLE